MRWSWLTGMVAVILVAVCGGAGTVVVWSHDRVSAVERTDARRAAVAEVARTVGLNLANAHHETIAEDLAALADLSTGDFAQQLAGREKNQIQVVRRLGLEMDGEVTGVGVTSVSADAATAIVAVSGRVLDSKLQRASADTTQQFYRLSLDLVRVDGAWKVSTLGFVS